MGVIELPTGKKASNEQAVAELERMLALAKEGKLDSLACTYMEEGVPMFLYTVLKDSVLTLGSLTRLINKIDRDA